jgi:hypothetical protein
MLRVTRPGGAVMAWQNQITAGGLTIPQKNWPG